MTSRLKLVTRQAPSMLYIVRLTNGDCVVTMARDENTAYRVVNESKLEPGESVESVRRLPDFCVRLTPTDSGTLEVHSWGDSTIDNILANEYPVLNQAIHAANTVRFMPPLDPSQPVLEQLNDAYAQNSEIIREDLDQEKNTIQPTGTMRRTARE